MAQKRYQWWHAGADPEARITEEQLDTLHKWLAKNGVTTNNERLEVLRKLFAFNPETDFDITYTLDLSPKGIEWVTEKVIQASLWASVAVKLKAELNGTQLQPDAGMQMLLEEGYRP